MTWSFSGPDNRATWEWTSLVDTDGRTWPAVAGADLAVIGYSDNRDQLQPLPLGVDRFAFPDADAEFVIIGSRTDWQRNVGREPTFESFGLGALKAFMVMNSPDDCYKHGITVRSYG
jgi:hypothetical protein